MTELASRFFKAAEINNISVEIVFIDDGSTDRTLQRICELEVAANPRVVVVSNQSNCGIARSWDVGLSKARGELVCFIDADLQNPPEEVFRLLRSFQASPSELVRGVRCPPDGIKSTRHFMSRGLNWLLNWVFGMQSQDNKTGFILTSRQVAREILVGHERYRYFQTFLGVAASSVGVMVTEVETEFHPRRSGTSFLEHQAFSVAVRVLCDFPLAIWQFRIRRGWKRG